jgi:hypothetical protein
MFIIALILIFYTVCLANSPTAKELLDKFAETADKSHTSFIIKAKGVAKSNNKFAGEWAHLSGKKKVYFLQEYRTDGDRLKRIAYKWGDYPGPGGRTYFRPETDKQVSIEVYDGEIRYHHLRTESTSGRVHIFQKEPEKTFTIGGMLAFDNHISKCFGYLEGDNERFDRILKRAKAGQVLVRDKMEDLNGTAHYVIDAKTSHGKYSIWINPEKGYNFSKTVVVRKPGDLFRGDSKIELGYERRYIIETSQFTNVNDIWVPSKAKMKVHYKYPRGQQVRSTKEVELISLLIDPDNEALDSFSIDGIRDGAKASVIGNGPSGEYVWRDGKVVDKAGKTIDLDSLRTAKSKRLSK